MENIVISNSKKLEEIKKKILQDGKEKFHVIADFDLTFTKAFVDNQKTHTVMAQFRSGGYLSENYDKKAHELFDKYHPIEIDLNISYEERKEKMHEWWATHFKLLIESGLNKKVIEKIVNDKNLVFRDEALDFIDFLHDNKIPLIIMSSIGLGDALSMYLEKQGKLYDNVHVISNLFEFDEKGFAVKVKEPIIHILNKNEISIKEIPIYEDLLKRRNVLLLGDGLGDIGMIKGFDYDNLIKIGFLNERVEENLEKYKENFDVVILNDGSFNYINKLVKNIIR